MSNYDEISIGEIHVPERLRNVDEDHALVISASIVEHGLFNPITVRKTPNGEAKFTLVAGAHRLRAIELCDDQVIAATIINADKDEAALIEIAENLFRNDLSVLDRARFVQTYRDVWEKRHGKIKRGGDQTGNLPLCLTDVIAEEARKGFAASCAERLGLSQDAVKRANRIAQNLTPAVRNAVENTPLADNQAALLKLAGLEPKVQKKAAVALEKTGGDFKETMTLINGGKKTDVDPQQIIFDRLLDAWSRSNEETKSRFLEYLNDGEKVEAA